MVSHDQWSTPIFAQCLPEIPTTQGLLEWPPEPLDPLEQPPFSHPLGLSMSFFFDSMFFPWLFICLFHGFLGIVGYLSHDSELLPIIRVYHIVLQKWRTKNLQSYLEDPRGTWRLNPCPKQSIHNAISSTHQHKQHKLPLDFELQGEIQLEKAPLSPPCPLPHQLALRRWGAHHPLASVVSCWAQNCSRHMWHWMWLWIKIMLAT